MDALELSPPKPLQLLLPVVLEHTIDERSPLFGHTSESLTVGRSYSGALFAACWLLLQCWLLGSHLLWPLLSDVNEECPQAGTS